MLIIRLAVRRAAGAEQKMSVTDGAMEAADDHKDCDHSSGERPFPQNDCEPKGARKKVLGKIFVVRDGKEKIIIFSYDSQGDIINT